MIGNRLAIISARAIALRKSLPGQRLSCSPFMTSASLSSGGHGHGPVDLMDKKHYPPGLQPPSYDDHYAPKGDWETHNKKLQGKYNMQLIAGLVIFGITVTYYFNCPDIDFVLPPKSIGVNPPKFSAYYQGPRRHGEGKPTPEQIQKFMKEWRESKADK